MALFGKRQTSEPEHMSHWAVLDAYEKRLNEHVEKTRRAEKEKETKEADKKAADKLAKDIHIIKKNERDRHNPDCLVSHGYYAYAYTQCGGLISIRQHDDLNDLSIGGARLVALREALSALDEKIKAREKEKAKEKK